MKRKDIINYAKESLEFRVLEYPERIIGIAPISMDDCLVLEDDEFFEFVIQMKDFDEDEEELK